MGKREKKSNPLQDYQRKKKRQKRQKKVNEKKEKEQEGFVKLGIDRLQAEHQKLDKLKQKNKITIEQDERLRKIRKIIKTQFKQKPKTKKVIFDPREKRRKIFMKHSEYNIEDINQKKKEEFDPTQLFFKGGNDEDSDLGDKYYVPIVDGIPLPKDSEPQYNPQLPLGSPPADNVALCSHANRFLKSKEVSSVKKKRTERILPPPIISSVFQKASIPAKKEEKRFNIGPILPSFGGD